MRRRRKPIPSKPTTVTTTQTRRPRKRYIMNGFYTHFQFICFFTQHSIPTPLLTLPSSQNQPEPTVPGSKVALGRREHQTLQHRHHQRSRCRPPKGMYLSQEDVVAVSCSASAANTLLRQLDMELVSLKRQVQG